MKETSITKTPQKDGVFLFKDGPCSASFDGESLLLTAYKTEDAAAAFLSDVLVHLAEEGEEQVILPDAGERRVYKRLGFDVDRDRCVVWEPVFRGKIHEREVVPPSEQSAWLGQQTAVTYKPTKKKKMTKKEKVTKKLKTMMKAKPKGVQVLLF